jgi:hypothetical protein
MKTLSLQPSLRDWTRSKPYRALALFAGIISAVIAVATLWHAVSVSRTTQQRVPVNSALPVATSPTSPSFNQPNLCGEWLSETSHKQYQFVCTGQDLFEIYEISDQGLNKTGSGKVTDDGTLEADFHSLTKNRWAHLKLTLSPDGRKMEGSFQGADPRESGWLTFRRV